MIKPLHSLRSLSMLHTTLTLIIYVCLSAVPAASKSSAGIHSLPTGKATIFGAELNSTKTPSIVSMNVTAPRTAKNRNRISKGRKQGIANIDKTVPTTKNRSTKTSTILRLQREWKQMILSGVAYDWYNQHPVRRRKLSIKTIATSTNLVDHETKNQSLSTSHIWIGPITKHQWYVWHFTFTCHDIGTNDTENPYYNGVYHGRIVLSKDYPLRPPVSIQLFTPNGRFETNQNICFTSITHYHPDQWNLNSNIYSMVESLRYHMITSRQGNGEIGAISYSSHEQKQWHATNSQSFRKYIPIQQRRRRQQQQPYRPSTRATQRTTTTTNPYHNTMIVVDHAYMIRMGYVKFPQPIAVDDTPDNEDVLMSSTSNPSVRLLAPLTNIDNITATLSKRKKKRRKKKTSTSNQSVAIGKKRQVRPRGHQWNILNHYTSHYSVLLVGTTAFLLILLSSSLLTVVQHPIFKICLVCCMTIGITWIRQQ